MANQTFYNLSAEKRERFIATALEEFAGYDYTTASLSRIAARLGIAKGSVYQYFTDKQELFLYLLEISNQTTLKFIQETVDGEIEGSSSGFFSQLRRMMSASVQAALRYPLQARLIIRAYTAPLPFQADIVQQGRQIRYDFLKTMVQRGIQTGELDAGLDPDLAARVLSAVINEIGPAAMERLALAPAQVVTGEMTEFTHPLLEVLFEQFMQMIRFGLADRGQKGDRNELSR